MKEHLSDNRISEATTKRFEEVGYRIRNKPVEHKHYKKDAMVNLDYNLLENQYVVRRFVQKRWGITLRELEIILYLYPKAFFSHQDYKDFPTSFTHRQIRSMIKLGHIQVFVDGENTAKKIYSLTKSAQAKVQNYYKYLSGEMQIPLDSSNKFIHKDASSHDQKVIKMFHKLAEANKKKED